MIRSKFWVCAVDKLFISMDIDEDGTDASVLYRVTRFRGFEWDRMQTRDLGSKIQWPPTKNPLDYIFFNYPVLSSDIIKYKIQWDIMCM